MKQCICLSIVLFFTITGILFPQQKEGTEAIWKDFSIVEKAEVVPETRSRGLESIQAGDALAYLGFLSSDLLEGRETGSRGYDIAAEFAAAMFSLWGIEPAGDVISKETDGRSASGEKSGAAIRSYFQEIQFKENLKNEGQLTVRYRRGAFAETRTFLPEIDYSYYTRKSESIQAPVVFVGYGLSEKSLKFDEYRGVDVKGKIVMILTETPAKGDPQSPFNQGKLKEKYYPTRRSRMRLSPKVKLAKEKGAIAVLLVENDPAVAGDVAKKTLDSKRVNDEKPIFSRSRRRLSLIEAAPPMPWETLPYIKISREMADTMLGFFDLTVEKIKAGYRERLIPQSRPLSGLTLTLENRAQTQLVRSSNILGLIEGSDPVLKNEVVVIGAHLDHLGRKGDYIFNGADDNGSGSVAVLEVAEAFAKNPVKPKRSVLFALWTGEEVGLLGSRYYVGHPYLPLKKTVANLNLDMVSRKWTTERLKQINRRWRLGMPEEALEKIDTDNFISLALDANSPAVDEAVRNSNKYLGMTLYIRRSKSRMWGTDHAPFAFHNIPWVFYFAATTEDYHEPSDSIEKVSPDLIEKVARLTYLTAFNLADH
jgi:hypothetical protein